MMKSIRDNRVCFVFESFEEAVRVLSMLQRTIPFYTQYRDEIVEIKSIREPMITVIFGADIKSLGRVEKHENVCVSPGTEDTVF